jgi:membrane-associated protease RseP (regulator of RpoE activity)
MFLLTVASVIYIGGLYGLTEAPPDDFLQAATLILSRGWPYALALMAILGAHEFGHYLVGRWHGVHVTLPYFIPMPFGISPFGTLGAFINMKEIPRNRKILLDIGIAGPLAGMAVAVPVLILGLVLSELNRLNPAPGMGFTLEGNNLLYLMSKFVVFGKLLPEPATYGDVSPILYWLQYFFTSTPLPLGGLDVQLHPVAWAGWAGLLVTSMNLIPVGQLDGGHILYVLLGRKNAQRVTPFVLGGLALLGLAWPGWWLWAGLIFFMGRAYAEPLDQVTPVDSRRKWLGALALLVFLVTFTPVPLSLLF